MLLLNDVDVVGSVFPNGETDFFVDSQNELLQSVSDYNRGCDFDIIDSIYAIDLSLVYEDDRDLFRLLMIGEYLKEAGLAKYTTLYMYFVPYSQMDREMPDHMFSLKYFSKLVNKCGFGKVVIRDPHSDVTPALFENIEVQDSWFTLQVQKMKPDVIMYPDAGAMKKYSNRLQRFVSYFNFVTPMEDTYNPIEVFGVKSRNLSTGEIISYDIHIPTGETVKGKSVLIVDDLVMGGRTFMKAAKALRDLGAASVSLHVTHLMPQAWDFYRTRADGLLDEIYTSDTLNVIGRNNNKESTEENTGDQAENGISTGRVILAKGDMMSVFHKDVLKHIGLTEKEAESANVTVIDTVNMNGFGGAGIAGMFKSRFPNVYKKYESWCRENFEAIRLGRLDYSNTVKLLYDKNPTSLLLVDAWGELVGNIPSTQRSVLLMNTMPFREFDITSSWAAINNSLQNFLNVDTSVLSGSPRVLVIPALGCGIGQVSWDSAKPLIIAFAKKYIEVGMYDKVVVMEPGYKRNKLTIIDKNV